jgi:hypothetical protein
MSGEHQPPREITDLLIQVDKQDVVVVEEVPNLLIISRAKTSTRQSADTTISMMPFSAASST